MSESEAKDLFLDCIREKGLRMTKQRGVILDAFLASHKHITVEELFDIVKKSNPEIGYATVHRNLSLMCECGLAEELKIGNQKARYEQKIGKAHHDHLICLRCGAFTEVHDEKIEKLQDKLTLEKGFKPLRHKLEIYGYCSRCI